ncbi:protoporphyrinogen oxidase [soil metagenome]
MSERRAVVVVVGGGITGLTVAYRLRERADVTLLEASPALGGNIATEQRDGFLLDVGPDSWVASKPSAAALVKEVGLEADLIGTNPATRKVYVAHHGELYPLPEGLVLGVPTRIGPMVTTKLFSWLGKARMGLEPLIAARDWSAPDSDEAVYDFIARRLGEEAASRLAGPLLGGIFAGDPKRLSVRAAFPQLVEMERKHRSLVRAMRAMRRVSHGSKAKSAFLSLRGGLGSLVSALAASLGERARASASARAIERRGERFVVLTDHGQIECDDVVFAVPPRQLAVLAKPFGALAEDAAAIAVTSSAAVFLAYARDQVSHPLDATGYIVPRSEGLRASASTWVSSKWEGRAPEGKVLLRAFFGGAGYEVDVDRSDDELEALARTEMQKLMGRFTGEPLFRRIARWRSTRGQPYVGHLSRMKTLHEDVRRTPGLHVAGGGYDGHAIPDCIAQANAVAETILRPIP